MSVTAAGVEYALPSFGAVISADGAYVAFTSAAHLVGSERGYHVYLWSRATRAVTLVDPGAELAFNPSISADGRYVVYDSDTANNVLRDTSNRKDIFRYDRVTRRTTRISLFARGFQADGSSYRPSISADGQRVAFVTDATNLFPADTNNVADIFVRDLWTRITHVVSRSTTGSPATAASDGVTSIAGNGTAVAFDSFANTLDARDADGSQDVYLATLRP